jgi:hypothetical protein
MPSHHTQPLSRGTESTGAVRRLVGDAQRETRALFREPDAVVPMTTPASADRPPAGPAPHVPATSPPAAKAAAFAADGPTVADAPRHPVARDAPGDRPPESTVSPAPQPGRVRPYAPPDSSSASRRLGRLLARRLGL